MNIVLKGDGIYLSSMVCVMLSWIAYIREKTNHIVVLLNCHATELSEISVPIIDLWVMHSKWICPHCRRWSYDSIFDGAYFRLGIAACSPGNALLNCTSLNFRGYSYSLEPSSLPPRARLVQKIQQREMAWKILVTCWTLMTFHGHSFEIVVGSPTHVCARPYA